MKENNAKSPHNRSFCFVLPNFHGEFSGGAETQCFYLAKELLNRGWEVHYIRESEESRIEDFQGIIVHAIPRQRKLFKWRNWNYLRKAMRNIMASVWYVRANISYLPLVVWHSKSLGGKTIWAFSRDSQFDLSSRNIKGRVVHNFVARLEHLLFFRSLKYVTKILLQTESQRELLSTQLKHNGEVIYNAHPVPTDMCGSTRDNRIVWVGRLQEFKHPERYLEIVHLLRNAPIVFYLIGDSKNNKIREEIRRQSASLPNFQWLGHVGLDDVHTILSKSKVLVNTSDYEGFSNTFVEAWMRGVPVVSLTVDPDNFIKERKIGIVAGSIPLAAREIEKLIVNDELWRKLSKNSLEFSRTAFNIVEAADKLERCVLSLGIGNRK